jgi:hypothetical protein
VSRFAKFLIALAVVNTLLFSMARIYDFPITWVIGGEFVCALIVLATIVMTSPARRLQRQAVLMGWEFLRMERDFKTGYQDAIFERDGLLIRISWKKGTVQVVGSADQFHSIAEVEQQIARVTGGR